MKNTSLITILIIIIVVFAIYIFIYGNEKLCKKGNLVNGYCETERTIFTMGLWPNGYNFSTIDVLVIMVIIMLM